jgi:hypothetical protein
MASPATPEVHFPKYVTQATLNLAAGSSEESTDPTAADPEPFVDKSPSAKDIEYPDKADPQNTDAAEIEPYTSEEHVGLEDEPRRQDMGEEGMTPETSATEAEDVDPDVQPFTSKETTGIDPTPRTSE